MFMMHVEGFWLYEMPTPLNECLLSFDEHIPKL
jgi:hypothetical protein